MNDIVASETSKRYGGKVIVANSSASSVGTGGSGSSADVPSMTSKTPDFVKNISKLIGSSGVIVDSDSIFLAQSDGFFLQEESGDGENLFSVIRKTKILPAIEIFRTDVPFFPGADFMFFLYGLKQISYKNYKSTIKLLKNYNLPMSLK